MHTFHFSKTKLFCFTCFFLITTNTQLFSQAGTQLMLDENSSFALQNVPIMEGVEEFQSKLDKIRIEENREPMGLVLSGGSARAFAHIGVLKSLEENHITPDFIVANSMGAIIGMLYAYGFSPDKIAEVISNINLTKYFDPVIPIHGGVLSVRQFRALINDLLGQDNFDLKDCPIPIIVLSEDLYSKRQIWHASGDFATVMTASFAMSVIMEPVKYTLHDDTETSVFLIDSGTIDIASLSVGEFFTDNIVLSTALYEPVLNYNNPVVVLNRTTSIGKERKAISDIKQFKPIVIRNDVEHFSFMAFDKAEELSQIGYNCTQAVLDEIQKCPHSYKDLSVLRSKTDNFASSTINKVLTGETLKVDENYFGLKIWPIFPSSDFPEYFLYNKKSLALYMFEDASPLYGRLGINFPFNFKEFCTDGFFSINPSSVFNFSLYASYSFSYDHFKPSEFYGATTIKIRPKFFPYALKSILTTAEYSADYKLSPQQFFLTSGLHFETEQEKNGYLLIKPYYFISGQDFSSLSNGVGVSFQSSVNAAIFKKMPQVHSFGLSDNFSLRYAAAPLGVNTIAQTQLLKSDFYRGVKPSEEGNLIFSNTAELYYVNLDPNLSIAELFIFQQLKIGPFYDICYNGTLYQTTGGFIRTQLSLIGLCKFIFEGGCGWNFNDSNIFGFFEMKTRM